MTRTRTFLIRLLILEFCAAAAVTVILLAGMASRLSLPWKNFLQAQALHPVSGTFSTVIAFLLAAVALVSGIRSELGGFALLCLATALLILGASLTALLHGLFLDPSAPLLAILTAFVVIAVFRATGSGSRDAALGRLFGQRLGREHFRRLVEGGAAVDFPGELVEASVLVCTIHNHVELMDVLSPTDYVALMNLYLRTASDFLVDVGGYLDECSGESLRVVLGAPLPVTGAPNHAAKAARVAVELVTRLEELNRECDRRWQQRLDFRIGVNSGPMIAAAFGGSRIGRYSVSGPVVEFARHLSAACAQYGCRILAGPLSYDLASATVEGRPIDLLQRAGSRRRVELFEFLAPKDSLSTERERSRDLFWKGVILFRERNWDEALRAFSSARIPGIPDRVLDHYLERVERARRGEDEPTPEQAILAESV